MLRAKARVTPEVEIIHPMEIEKDFLKGESEGNYFQGQEV